MKPSKTTLEALADISQIQTTGDLRRVGSQMLLALARKEISATDVMAGSKMMDAVSNSMNVEIKLAVAAQSLRESGAKLTQVENIGLTVIGA